MGLVLDLPEDGELQLEDARRALPGELGRRDGPERHGRALGRHGQAVDLLPQRADPVAPPLAVAGQAGARERAAAEAELGVEGAAAPDGHRPVVVVERDADGEVVGDGGPGAGAGAGPVGAAGGRRRGEGEAGEGGVVDGDADGDDEGVRGDEHRREDERRDEAAAADGRHDVAGAVGGRVGVGVGAAARDDEVPAVEVVVVVHQARRPRPTYATPSRGRG